MMIVWLEQTIGISMLTRCQMWSKDVLCILYSQIVPNLNGHLNICTHHTVKLIDTCC